MSNVIHLAFPSRSEQRAARYAALLDTFANHRRDTDDVFWLKENAEILNILECTGQDVAPEALSVYRGFYDTIEERLEFFPQYYRFLLSICLDLETLGLGGGKGRALAQWVADQGLIEAELSDLQRGEATRLMTRVGVSHGQDVTLINDRLSRFVSRPTTFSVPNKKAAYELTHIAFYLSEYGRRDPDLGSEAEQSLKFTGTLAFLDCNWDLLAEVLVAMRYCGLTPPAEWQDAIAHVAAAFAVAEGDDAVRQDDYHAYLVCNWALSTSGGAPFQARLTPGPVSFHSQHDHPAPLRELSEVIYGLNTRRSSDWQLMRDYVCENVSPDSADILIRAEAACDCFGDFFAGFARTGMRSGRAEAARA
ncbi:hypothetical protein OB2597_02352 [Pseudooceanicola batsensis HTCC2597]|uniref:Uncharacterized protein n=1 Tax=Pseudooceanicola batsensis (strain ATCC BAA-863 / DSM 15984 / KCTC 12145 / HTCC2597) TaxID=252305 RepID=A3TX64_PSEBH|nr:hypothetical protein [Pseudooceanicola batsensis]EAQ03424.1 hypothetical protein OB2597_02352 [Pseudooceanicola batsensis HTCC2597]